MQPKNNTTLADLGKSELFQFSVKVDYFLMYSFLYLH